jgi:hypothetical protein
LAVALLVVNDHVLKTAFPSWITGKLSDFAGLFVFPLLLIALLSLIVPRWLRPDRVGQAAFVITGLWFGAVKTLPAANRLTGQLIGAALGGGPLQIALDPTDLMALLMLLPAWRLWRRTELVLPPVQRLRRLAGHLALGVAGIATIATSPPVPDMRLERLAVHDHDVYADLHFVDDRDAIGNSPGEPVWPRRSIDGGEWWSQLNSRQPSEQVPAEVRAMLVAPRASPVVACVPLEPATCYRSAGPAQVETSQDGGETWQLSWELPQHRLEYLRQSEPPGVFDPGPFDLVVLPWQNGYRVIVALGSEGVVVRDQTGTWTQHAVEPALPRPLYPASVAELANVSYAAFWPALLLALAMIWVLARRTGMHRRAGSSRALVGLLLLAVTVGLGYVFSPVLSLLTLAYFPVAPVALFLAASALLWLPLPDGLLGRIVRVLLALVWGAAVAFVALIVWQVNGSVCWDALSETFYNVMQSGGLADVMWLITDSPCTGTVNFALFCAVPVGFVLWLRYRPQEPPSRRLHPSIGTLHGVVGLVFLAAWLPFPIWGVGLIGPYDLALALSLLGTALALCAGWWIVERERSFDDE